MLKVGALRDSAKDHHLASKVKFISGWKTTPLLSWYINFYKAQYLSKLCEDLVKSVDSNDVIDGYLDYMKKCQQSQISLPIAYSSDLPLSFEMLPGKAPVLDHIYASLSSQSETEGGGTFKPFLEETLENLCKFRQMCYDSLPQTHVLVFSKASVDDLNIFFKSFNSSILRL